MVFISVTRLRVRSIRHLPGFIRQAFVTARQAERAPGFLSGKVMREAKNVFWTVTAWEDEETLRAYRSSGAHREVMPKLLDWCDEASVAHWHQEVTELPGWQEAHRRMVTEGRLSKVRNPSPAQAAKRIPEPQPGTHLERTLKPART